MRRRPRPSQSGSTLIESCVVIVMVCLVFFGLLQYSILVNANQTLDFAAFAAARSKTVGFHDGIVFKSFRVASIPNAGAMRLPMQGLSARQQLALERTRIPWYLQDIAALDYDRWPTMTMIYPVVSDDFLMVATLQPFPMAIPMAGAFYDKDFVWLQGRAGMENHYPYYLQSR